MSATELNERSRDVRAIQLPRWGRVAADPGAAPWLVWLVWLVFDEEGKVALPVRRFAIDFIARDNRTGRVRGYACDRPGWEALLAVSRWVMASATRSMAVRSKAP